MEHLKAGVGQVQPSNVQMYENLSTKFQRLVHSIAKEDDSESEPCPIKPSNITLWYVMHRFFYKLIFLQILMFTNE